MQFSVIHRSLLGRGVSLFREYNQHILGPTIVIWPITRGYHLFIKIWTPFYYCESRNVAAEIVRQSTSMLTPYLLNPVCDTHIQNLASFTRGLIQSLGLPGSPTTQLTWLFAKSSPTDCADWPLWSKNFRHYIIFWRLHISFRHNSRDSFSLTLVYLKVQLQHSVLKSIINMLSKVNMQHQQGGEYFKENERFVHSVFCQGKYSSSHDIFSRKFSKKFI